MDLGYLMHLITRLIFGLLFVCIINQSNADDWPRFRGPNGSGVSLGQAALPDTIGPQQNLAWKIEIPAGVSSPVIFDDRI